MRAPSSVTPSRALSVFVLVSLASFAACRDPATGAGAGAGDGAGAGAEASRAAVQTCKPSSVVASAACPSRELPPSNASSSTGCRSDAECTQGVSGRCVRAEGPTPAPRHNLLAGPPPPRQETVCLYDECRADADCGARGRCVCGGPARRNTCFPTDQCLSDRDCASGSLCNCGDEGAPNQCRESTCRTDSDCAAGLPCAESQGGRYCRTPRDRCRADADCGGGRPCRYSRGERAWSCGPSGPVRYPG